MNGVYQKAPWNRDVAVMTECVLASLLIEMLHDGEFHDLVREAIAGMSRQELTQLAQLNQNAQSSRRDIIKPR